jgi:hypothetical protein
MRAFIFSLDAFVAFTLALMAIYTLIFFSSVPSAYYFLLTQGHYLSRDTLLALSLASCTDNLCKAPGSSILDNIVVESKPGSGPAIFDPKLLVKDTVGSMIPKQFGYALEVSADGGNTWGLVYDTASAHDPDHVTGTSRKFAVATQILNFGYSGKVKKLVTSPYMYLTCNGQGQAEGGSPGSISGGATSNTTLGIITCGYKNITNNDGTITQTPFGNIPPAQILGDNGAGDLVPASDVELVKLIVYI